jgi:hypothetical protein
MDRLLILKCTITILSTEESWKEVLLKKWKMRIITILIIILMIAEEAGTHSIKAKEDHKAK